LTASPKDAFNGHDVACRLIVDLPYPQRTPNWYYPIYGIDRIHHEDWRRNMFSDCEVSPAQRRPPIMDASTQYLVCRDATTTARMAARKHNVKGLDEYYWYECFVSSVMHLISSNVKLVCQNFPAEASIWRDIAIRKIRPNDPRQTERFFHRYDNNSSYEILINDNRLGACPIAYCNPGV
jgi:hypothetical protein